MSYKVTETFNVGKPDGYLGVESVQKPAVEGVLACRNVILRTELGVFYVELADLHTELSYFHVDFTAKRVDFTEKFRCFL